MNYNLMLELDRERYNLLYISLSISQILFRVLTNLGNNNTNTYLYFESNLNEYAVILQISNSSSTEI